MAPRLFWRTWEGRWGSSKHLYILPVWHHSAELRIQEHTFTASWCHMCVGGSGLSQHCLQLEIQNSTHVQCSSSCLPAGEESQLPACNATHAKAIKFWKCYLDGSIPSSHSRKEKKKSHHVEQKWKLLSKIECKCLPIKLMYLNTDSEGQAQAWVSGYSGTWGLGDSPFLHSDKEPGSAHPVSSNYEWGCIHRHQTNLFDEEIFKTAQHPGYGTTTSTVFIHIYRNNCM